MTVLPAIKVCDDCGSGWTDETNLETEYYKAFGIVKCDGCIRAYDPEFVKEQEEEEK